MYSSSLRTFRRALTRFGKALGGNSKVKQVLFSKSFLKVNSDQISMCTLVLLYPVELKIIPMEPKNKIQQKSLNSFNSIWADLMALLCDQLQWRLK